MRRQKAEPRLRYIPVRTRTNLIVESIEAVRNVLTCSPSFFIDLRKEGIPLYDTGEFRLARLAARVVLFRLE